MMDFNTWKDLQPVQDAAENLGFNLAAGVSWQHFGERFRTANDKNVGHLVNRAREIADRLSSGELPVMLAMLHAADFSYQADELSRGEIWSMLDRTHGDHATAVALAIMKPGH
ncbi:MAG: hypothetical protein RLO18_00090 [Gimesia chilikensis]